MRVQAPLDSKIVERWPQFVSENAQIFGLEAADLSPGRKIGPVVSVVQSFHGAEIYPRFGNVPSSSRAVGTDLIIGTDFTKTKGWAFGTLISSAAASKSAEAGWAAEILEGDEYADMRLMSQAEGIGKYAWARLTHSTPQAKDARLVILTDQPTCIRCGFTLPSPVWIVTPATGDGECDVNAVTGELCKPCSTAARSCSL